MPHNIYIDCEFTNFHGELLSMAMVAEDDRQPFYVVLDVPTSRISPWSLINVVPKLARVHGHDFVGSIKPVDRETAARSAVAWLTAIPSETPHLIADWPEDLSHFLNLLTFKPGQMVRSPDLTFEYRRLPDFMASRDSREPHNALLDAIALRDYSVQSSA